VLPAGRALNSSSLSVGRNMFIRSHVMVQSWEYPSQLENTPAESITNSMFFSDSGIASYCKKHKQPYIRTPCIHNCHSSGSSSATSFSLWQPGFDPRSDHVGYAVDKVALGQIFSIYRSQIIRLPRSVIQFLWALSESYFNYGFRIYCFPGSIVSLYFISPANFHFANCSIFINHPTIDGVQY
jgi:hypothetical protein